MQGRLLGLLVLGCSAILLTSCGRAREEIDTISPGSLPAWSPDGRTLAFIRQPQLGPPAADRELVVMDVDGSDMRTLSRRTTNVEAPRWSPDGGSILFVSEDGLSVVDADGTNEHRLTRDPTDHDASWSPDGRSVVFTGWPQSAAQPYNSGIYVIEADGTGRRRVTPRSVHADSPAWSPDGERIAFVRNRWKPRVSRLDQGISVIDVDGTHERRLTHKPGMFRSLAWSPSGRTLAFVTGPPVRVQRRCCRIGIVDLAQQKQRSLTPASAKDTVPAWSPDGSRIALWRSYSRGDGGNAVYVIDTGGRVEQRVTKKLPRAGPGTPVWAPSGDRLAFDVGSADHNIPGEIGVRYVG